MTGGAVVGGGAVVDCGVAVVCGAAVGSGGVVGAWPASKKVIDVALHKFEAADGQRRVRTVDADDAD